MYIKYQHRYVHGSRDISMIKKIGPYNVDIYTNIWNFSFASVKEDIPDREKAPIQPLTGPEYHPETLILSKVKSTATYSDYF